MKIGFTFPGQGSQFVGMGKGLAEFSATARAVFEEVDEALHKKLSQIIFEGPEESLKQTMHTQPALMAVSLAVLRFMESQGLDIKSKVSYCAGHSLGEYSALCAVGSFSLADTARLLELRGRAMQEAVPLGKGAMAAIIGLTEQEVEDLCKKACQKGEVCQIANDNGGGQFVVSGSLASVEQMLVLAKEAKAKRALLLPVSAPFHSVLMQPAAHIMEEALEKVQKNTPIVPVISNVRVAPEESPQSITQLLVQQVCGRVRWRETIEWFAHHDVKQLYEIGAGRVLTGLARRINPEIECMPVLEPKEIETALEKLDI